VTNRRAFVLWTELLDQGVRIAATSGRDWHDQTPTEDPLSVTYIGVEDSTRPLADEVVRSLRRGRVAVTIGPLVTLEVGSRGRSYAVGDCCPLDERIARVAVRFSVRPGLWALAEQTFRLRMVGNAGVVGEIAVPGIDAAYSFQLPAQGMIWTRAELWGEVNGDRLLIAFTNAVYFEQT